MGRIVPRVRCTPPRARHAAARRVCLSSHAATSPSTAATASSRSAAVRAVAATARLAG